MRFIYLWGFCIASNGAGFFCFFFFPFCIFTTDEWSKLITPLHDPALQRLAAVDLPALLVSSKADSTTKQYLAYWRKWEVWVASHPSISVFPVTPFHLSLYLAHLASTGPKSAADPTIAAVKWIHGLAGFSSPTDNPMVKNALQGFKRIHSSPTARKLPITPQILREIWKSHGQAHATLADLRILFISFISYAGFLRFDDLRKISRNSCTFTQDCLTIHLPSSKSDQFRQGSDIVIARSAKDTCPVRVAERYFAVLGDSADCSLPALRRLQTSKRGLIPSSHPLSYSRTREIILDAIKPFVPDISRYGLHSMRSGGASAAFNAHVPPFLISKHGRWSSEKARNKYLQTDSESKLFASKCLGI